MTILRNVLSNVLSAPLFVPTAVSEAVDAYLFGGQSAALVVDHAGVLNEGVPYYRKQGATTTFSDLFGTRYDRSDRATMFDSDGNLVWNAHNSVTDSKDLSGDWLTQNGSISATSTTGPFGETVSNSLFIPSATSSNSHRTIANSAALISFSGTFKIGFYVKPSGYTKIGFRNGGFSNHASWDASGAGSVIEELNCSTTITAVDNGWYYITIASDASVTSLRLDLHAMDDSYTSGSPGSYTFTGDGTSGAFFTRVRCYSNNLGGMATVPADVQDNGETDYVPTTGTARFLSRRENYRYNGSSWVLAGHLEEPAATNLIPSDPADWNGVVTNLTVTQNAATSTSGKTDATSLITTDTVAGSNHLIRHALTKAASALDYTFRIHVKKSTGGAFDFCSILLHGTSTSDRSEADIELSTGTVQTRSFGTGFSVVRAGAKDLGNGYWDFYVTINSNSDTTLGLQFYVSEAHNDRSLDGDGTSGLFAQFSALTQDSFPTSPIINNSGGSLVRATDVKSGQVLAADSFYDSTAMSAVWHGRGWHEDDGGSESLNVMDWGPTATRRIYMGVRTISTRTGEPVIYMRDSLAAASGELTALGTSQSLYPAGQENEIKMAGRWLSSGVAQMADTGGLGTEATNASATYPDLSAEAIRLSKTFTGNVQMICGIAGDIGSAGLSEGVA